MLLLEARLKSQTSKVPINSGMRMLALFGVSFAVVSVDVFSNILRWKQDDSDLFVSPSQSEKAYETERTNIHKPCEQILFGKPFFLFFATIIK